MARRKHILAHLLPGHRTPKRPMPLMHVLPHMAVRGTDNGDTYTDDYGATWTFATRAAVPAGEVSASTSSYGGKQSPWYSRPFFGGNGHDNVISWIDVNAGVAHAIDDTSGGGGSGGSGDRPGGGGTIGPIKGGTSAPVTKAISDAFGTASQNAAATGKPPASSWTYVAVLVPPIAGGFLAGPIGIGIGIAVGVGAYLVSKKAA